MPIFRELWEHIGKEMPKKGRGEGRRPRPARAPDELQTALEALYGHYEKTFELWKERASRVPPCFIVVCNNTSIVEAGVRLHLRLRSRRTRTAPSTLENGRLALFRNFDDSTATRCRARTRCSSTASSSKSGDALDDNFRKMAADEIERFRREIIERTGDARAAENITDQELLREVMNTVGKPGQLGETSAASCRCRC